MLFRHHLSRPLVGGLAAFALASIAHPAHAGFFIPKGTTMVMSTLSPDEQNYDIAYGFDRRISGALGVTRVREGGAEAAWRNVATGHMAYLIDRTSTEKGIFNAYVFAGPIAERLEGESSARAGGQVGLWLDYETRRIYTRVKLHGFKTEGWRRNEVVAQAMIAPYEADYEDIASWGGVQLKRVSGERKTEVTPFVRFFQRNWWVDAGVSVNRPYRNNYFFNVMYTF